MKKRIHWFDCFEVDGEKDRSPPPVRQKSLPEEAYDQMLQMERVIAPLRESTSEKS